MTSRSGDRTPLGGGALCEVLQTPWGPHPDPVPPSDVWSDVVSSPSTTGWTGRSPVLRVVLNDRSRQLRRVSACRLFRLCPNDPVDPPLGFQRRRVRRQVSLRRRRSVPPERGSRKTRLWFAVRLVGVVCTRHTSTHSKTRDPRNESVQTSTLSLVLKCTRCLGPLGRQGVLLTVGEISSVPVAPHPGCTTTTLSRRRRVASGVTCVVGRLRPLIPYSH